MENKIKLEEIRKLNAARQRGTLSEQDFAALSDAMRRGDAAYLRQKTELGFDVRPRLRIHPALRRVAEFLLAFVIGGAALLAGAWAVAELDNGTWGIGAALFLLLAGAALYFLPAFIASQRGHPQATGIFVLNLVLGWTFLGWAGALVWAFTDSKSG